MTGEAAGRQATRAEIESAIADYISSGVGASDIKREVARLFPFIPRTTLYRWIAQAIQSGAAGRIIEARAEAAAEVPRQGVAVALAQAVPPGTVTAIPMAEKMMLVIESIEGVLRYARGENPKRPVNAKLTVKSAVELARALEQAMKLHEALTQAARLDEFHGALLREIERESPEVAARITARLRAMTGQIGA